MKSESQPSSSPEEWKDYFEPVELPEKQKPILETEKSISYLGVTLEKAENGGSQFVPKREQYKDFINDKEIALPLQRDMAVSFLSGDPLLVDGGTSLGKTTTVRKMASELGYEVHYANLNGATDVEDLMGRYIPNPHKNKPEDPEYIFADGKVTSGLRQEEGKVKVIILDEFNASAPNILIRLHEVLDALERGGDVVLSEDASEAVPANKNTTKVVALMNPPGKGYFGREPLDPAQLRRWVYKKMPSELPAETFSHATDALFSAVSEDQEVTPEMYLKANEQALQLEQLQEIPGIAEILEKYKEFHKAAKELLKNRKIAEDQPQPFMYDDRMEPRRVRDFILRFYNGDVSQTFQQALEYYYANKLETEADKKKLGELIRLVEYMPKTIESKRKGFEREVVDASSQSEEINLDDAIEKKEKEKIFYSINFTKVEKKGGRIEYKSSDPTRKLIVLDDLSALKSKVVPGDFYDVKVIRDTDPKDSMKGKYIAEIISESVLEAEEVLEAEKVGPIINQEGLEAIIKKGKEESVKLKTFGELAKELTEKAKGKEFIRVGVSGETIRVNDEIEKNGWKVGQRVKIINEGGIAYFLKELKGSENIVIVGFAKDWQSQDVIVLQLDGDKVVTEPLHYFPKCFGLRVPDEQKVTEEEVLGLYQDEEEKDK